MKKVVTISLVLFLSVGLVACENPSSNQDKAQEVMSKKTGRLQAQAVRQTGMPEIENFRERKIAKWIYELRDEKGLSTHTYVKSEYKGKFHYLGKTIGYGLPYSVQFSNPKRTVGRFHKEGIEQLPQPEPNGLYPPEGLAATWILLDTGKGNKPEPLYVESDIIVSQSKLPKRLLVEVPDNY